MSVDPTKPIPEGNVLLERQFARARALGLGQVDGPTVFAKFGFPDPDRPASHDGVERAAATLHRELVRNGNVATHQQCLERVQGAVSRSDARRDHRG